MAAMIGVSCSTDAQYEEPAASPEAGDIAFIESLGYDVSDIVTTEFGYLVEGDILFTPETMKELRATPATRHTSQGQLIDSKYQKRVYLNIGVPTAQRAAIMSAISEWNSLENCNINFIDGGSDTQETMVQALALPAYFPLLTIEVPVGGKPSASVLVNTSHPDYTTAAADQIRYMWMHALGHVIGFGHTPNSISEAIEPGMTQLPGTVDFNGSSIMRRDESPLTWEGFSLQDMAAFSAVYPYKKLVWLKWYEEITWVTPSRLISVNTLNANVQYVGILTVDTDYFIYHPGVGFCYWIDYAEGMSGQAKCVGGNRAEITFYGAGTHSIRLDYYDRNGESYEEIYTVEVV